MTQFQALEVSIDTIRSLRVPLARLRRADADLARQLRRALSSVPLNLSEGLKRRGQDQTHHWRIALGSIEEARTALRVAEAFGYLELDTLGESWELIDRTVAMLYTETESDEGAN